MLVCVTVCASARNENGQNGTCTATGALCELPKNFFFAIRSSSSSQTE